MKYFVVGDIHGCVQQLELLLEHKELYADRRVVFLGDYVDVGPNPAAVIGRLVDFRSEFPSAVFLQGNHDSAFLSYIRAGDFVSYAQIGGLSTIRSYTGPAYGNVHASLVANMPQPHLEFLEGLEIYLETSKYLFSHCGYDTGRPADRSRAAMVLTTHPALFTSPPSLGKTAVCGHYFQRTLHPHISDGVLCLDTGCGILNGPLTAIQLPEKLVFQATADLTWQAPSAQNRLRPGFD